tara:strand:- start:3273 stop:3503 length:231 start_codon:yes stop_codon:yes gene_type:complete
MAEVVANTGVKKESGYLYYLDKNGNVSRSKMARAGKGGGNAEKVADAGVTRESGYLYYIDKNGDVARSPMARGRKK